MVTAIVNGQAVQVKACRECGGPVIRREKEAHLQYAVRETCSRPCGRARLRRRVNKELEMGRA